MLRKTSMYGKIKTIISLNALCIISNDLIIAFFLFNKESRNPKIPFTTLCLPVFIFIKVRSLDIQQSWQNVDKNFSDPRGHFVSFRSSEMNVEHQHSHTNAEK